MNAKLRHIDRWRLLPSGEGLNLPGGLRNVTVEFNVDASTRIDVVRDGVDPVLLIVVEPGAPQKVQFAVSGDCTLVPTSEGEVWYSTDDGDGSGYPVETESFTSLEQRTEMTPEMEITMLKANIRLEQRRTEIARLQLQREQRRQALEARANTETGEVDEPEVVVDPDAGAAEPATVAGDKPASKP